jgi:hypothetical protein
LGTTLTLVSKLRVFSLSRDTAYAQTVTEISRIKLHNELGTQQRISASAAKQGISEIDHLPIPEWDESVYVGTIWFKK